MTAVSPAARRKPRLLIVEDEPDLRVLIQFAARRAEVFSTICTAEDGEMALEMIQAGVRGERADMPPDIVFTDYNMPRLNGLELAEQLRATADTAEIAVALFTAAQSPADRAAARRAGCCANFRKPAGLVELTSMLKSLPIFSRGAGRDGSVTPFPLHVGRPDPITAG
ncbi:MAG TPA: response regulator [Opitutaceae bacterium]|nr:response regulator [Opitutaceae bacterium]